MFDTNMIWTFDQLLRQRAIDEDQTPLLAFPKTKQGITDYDPITGACLNRFVDGAAQCLVQKGFPKVDEEVIVGVCAPTDLDYIVTIFALIRLGYTAFQLSPRLAPKAIRDLLAMKQNGRPALLHAPDHPSFKVEALSDLDLHLIVARNEYDNSRGETLESCIHTVYNAEEQHQRCLMLHSSGSTGLPKPIDYDHQKLMAAGVYAQDAIAFITMPFSHSFGMLSYMQAIHRRKTIYAMSGYVPQTHNTVTAALKAAGPEIMWTVPYVLKLLAEKPDGIEALRNCRFVSSGGSKLPDELGDMLTDAGVHIGMQFGSTETGLILSSAYRPRGDRAWNYLRPPPHVVRYLTFNPIDNERHECIVLNGHRGLTMSNSDNPPNSWHTNDLFVPHPSISNAWKFVGRMDDRITLLNGEKVLPVTIEGRIRHHRLVREAVIFGTDREVPGLLLFRAVGSTDLDDEQFLGQVWPTIEYANSHAEAFSQITREMVAIIAEDVECPLTDKCSIKRGVIYTEFASVINATYSAAESSNKSKSLQLEIPDLEEWLVCTVRSQGVDIEDVSTDFFSAGMDSLQAIHLRSQILRNLDLGGHDSQFTSMMVFDCGNARRLASRLFSIRTRGSLGIEQDRTLAMTALIEKHSQFAKYECHTNSACYPSSKDEQIIILTGATGFLGAHILAALVASMNVRKVYTFLRPGREEGETPLNRLETSLRSKGFSIPLQIVVPLYYDIEQPWFALDTPALYKMMELEVTHVIHCAWSVNFAIPLSAFEPQLLGLHNLLNFALHAKQRPRLLFCSSIGVAQSTKGPATITSGMIPSLDECGSMGYAESKLVGEHIVESAVKKGANASVLRIGQIIPGRRRGTKLWNPTEAIPLMIRSASNNSTGALPLLDTGRDTCSWIEADTLADTILQLGGIGHVTDSATAELRLVYNLVNPRVFSWKNDLLPALRHAGYEFDIVTWTEWLERLQSSTTDVSVNPSRKLLDFWSKQARVGGLTFDTTPAEAASSRLRNSSLVLDGGHMEQISKAWKQDEAESNAS